MKPTHPCDKCEKCNGPCPEWVEWFRYNWRKMQKSYEKELAEWKYRKIREAQIERLVRLRSRFGSRG